MMLLTFHRGLIEGIRQTIESMDVKGTIEFSIATVGGFQLKHELGLRE